MTDQPQSLADLVGAYLAEQCAVIIEASRSCEPGERHPRHRVLRSGGCAARSGCSPDLFDEAKAAQLEEELVWWAELSGPARDLDILQASMTARMTRAAGVLGPVESTIQTLRSQASARVAWTLC